MTDRPVPCEGLPADVRARLVRLLSTELSGIWSSAVAAGGSTRQLLEIVDQRQRVIAMARPCDPRKERR